jgi:hypothetical protein
LFLLRVGDANKNNTTETVIRQENHDHKRQGTPESLAPNWVQRKRVTDKVRTMGCSLWGEGPNLLRCR